MKLDYAAAGVHRDAAETAVGALAPHLARTARPEVISGVGGFAGLFAFDLQRWREPVLVSATDGVGTKLEVARRLGRHDTIGLDLVAMVVDDLVVPGAEPLFFLDYLAVGALDPIHVEQVVAGIADGCAQVGAALVGGETAEHPGVMPAGAYDLAGFAVGVVEREALLGPQRVRSGDAVVAMASTGLHSNGYSLARRIVEGLDLSQDHGLAGEGVAGSVDRSPDRDPQSLGDALLRPTWIYTPDCLALAAACEVHALCHVTGGGISANLPRVLPDGLGAVVDMSTFSPPAIFGWLQQRGGVADDEMWQTFNMGAGMLALVPDGAEAVTLLGARGLDAWVCGAVNDSGQVELVP